MESTSSSKTRPFYALAEKAYEEKNGARGLVSAVERVLLKFEKTLPSTDIRSLVVTLGDGREPRTGTGHDSSGILRSGAPGQV